MNETGSTAALLKLIGPAALIKLTQQHGGTRVYINTDPARSAVLELLGVKAAAKLAGRYGGDYLRVPLARELRARYYRAAGWTNAQIATQLGITEGGVNQIFARMRGLPAKGSGADAQLKLFS